MFFIFQEEITREYLKPPPNKSVFDVPSSLPEMDCHGTQRSFSMGVLPDKEWASMKICGSNSTNRHSAPLEPHLRHSPANTLSSSSSSSSSGSSWGCSSEDSRGSPRRGKKSKQPPFIAQCISLTPFNSSKLEKNSQEGGRRTHRSNYPFQDPRDTVVFENTSTLGQSLDEIDVLPCSPATNGPSCLSRHQLSTPLPRRCEVQGTSLVDPDEPSLCCETAENSRLCPSASADERTNSGKI